MTSTTSASYTLQDSPRWRDYFIDVSDESTADPQVYMGNAMKERMRTDETLSDYDKMVIQHLAMRKFHIPGNGYWEDYWFWFSNNHPFLCFCLADKRHPLGVPERIMNLLSSLAFGLCATCGVVLWFYYQEGWEFDAMFMEWYGVEISYGLLALFVFGGPLHVAFDLSFFFLQSCPPCRTGGACARHMSRSHRQCWLWIGANTAFLITLVSISLGINVMLLRASIEDDGNADGVARNIKHYDFLLLYLLECLIANWLVFPAGSFTVFTCLRPFQVRKSERIQRAKRREGGGQSFV